MTAIRVIIDATEASEAFGPDTTWYAGHLMITVGDADRVKVDIDGHTDRGDHPEAELTTAVALAMGFDPEDDSVHNAVMEFSQSAIDYGGRTDYMLEIGPPEGEYEVRKATWTLPAGVAGQLADEYVAEALRLLGLIGDLEYNEDFPDVESMLRIQSAIRKLELASFGAEEDEDDD